MVLVFVNIKRELSAFESQGGWMHKSTHVTREEEDEEEDEATAVEYISPTTDTKTTYTGTGIPSCVCT